MRYLSDAWIAALDEAVRSDAEVRTAAGATELVIQQTVTGTAHGDTVYRVVIDAGGRRVVRGADPAATVHLTTDLDTATAIASGRLAAQDAFMQGRLRIGGDVTALLAHQAIFASVADAARSVRDQTTW